MNHGRQELIAFIEAAAREAFAGDLLRDHMRSVVGWRKVTTRIKEVFGDLGSSLGYMVAASGYPKATQGEWLYDMSWFSAQDEIFLSRLTLALETELSPRAISVAALVDDDFMKLVQARAEVRVWLTLLPNTEILRIHLQNCKRQASLFSSAQLGDAYVFVLYNWSTGETTVEPWEVDSIPEHSPNSEAAMNQPYERTSMT